MRITLDALITTASSGQRLPFDDFLQKFSLEQRVHNPHGNSGKNNLRRGLLLSGLSLYETALAEKIILGYEPQRQAIGIYVHRHGLKDVWEEAKRHRQLAEQQTAQSLEQKRSELCSLLRAYFSCKLQNSSKAVQAVHQYSLQNRHAPQHFSKKLMALFEIYYSAKKRGERYSLAELHEKSGVSTMSISHILECAGEEPMYGSRQRTPLKSWQIRTIDRLYREPYASVTVAYFLGVAPHSVQQRWRTKTNKKRQPSSTVLTSFFLRGGSDVLTLVNASEIYEAYDAGITSLKDIALLMGKTTLSVQYALDKRPEIQEKLVAIIRKIYDDPCYDKPYITQALREKKEQEEHWTQQRLFPSSSPLSSLSSSS